jgi:GWxTD domain-containing protein
MISPKTGWAQEAVSGMKAIRLSISCICLLALLIAGRVFRVSAQDNSNPNSANTDNTKNNSAKKAASSSPRETVAKPLSVREQKKRDEKLRKELETPYKKWLEEDVAYIITDEERATFKRLQTDEEREQFIEQFWLRRDPTPDTVENEYKEEHYRRIAYANDHYASGIPGWKTDRGRIYIVYGPPDEIESHPSGGTYERPYEEGGGTTSTYPFEQWTYRYIEGVGTNIMIEFVDTTMSGEYHMTMDPSEKDALLYVPGAGLTLMEQMGMADKTQRFQRTDGTHLGVPQNQLPASMDEFSRLDQYTKLQKPPEVKFKDLEATVNSRITYNILPMKARADFFPVTDASVVTYITLQFDNKDLQFQLKEGVQKAVVNIYGRITTMTRRVANVFEDTVTVDSAPSMLQAMTQQKSIYQKAIPLKPGTYRLNVVAKDLVGGNINNYEVALTVPSLDPDKMTSSTMVLADIIEPVATRNIGMGQFVIGSSKVRPRIDSIFKQEEKMGIYLTLYNLGADDITHKPDGQVEYQVLRTGNGETIFDVTEDLAKIPGASAMQATIEKLLPLKTLSPGNYTIKVKVTDKNRNQILTPSAQFTVT